MSRPLRALTNRQDLRDDVDVDRASSVEDAIGTAQRLIREIIHRQLRYQPRCTGEITISVSLREGLPYRIRELTDVSQFFGPVLRDNNTSK